MPKITMTATREGADDGFTVRTYEEGRDYDVSDDLARAFVADKAAVFSGGGAEPPHMGSAAVPPGRKSGRPPRKG